jgi:hypothetical protein
MNMKLASYVLLLLSITATISAQSPPAPPASPPEYPRANDSAPPATDFDRLQSFAAESAQQIAALHIDKWKGNESAKSTAQSDAESLHRNLTTVLPGFIDAARANPGDVNAQFKLYRDVNALYEVFDSLTESARIFGQKGQYEALSTQFKSLASIRRNLGAGLEELTASTQFELQRLRAEVKNDQQKLATAQSETAEARKQVVLAQAELEKKPAPRKKSATKKPAPTANSANANSPSAGNGAASSASSNPPKQ